MGLLESRLNIREIIDIFSVACSCTLGHDSKNCSDGSVKNVTKGK
jgi:hypothetical protein